MQHTLDLRTYSSNQQSQKEQQFSGSSGSVPSSTGIDGSGVRASLLRMAGIVGSVVVMWVYLPNVAASLAYFTDTEGAPAGLSTGLLELTVTDPSITAIGCGGMADLVVPVSVETNGFPAVVRASTTAVFGDSAFCSALLLDVEYLGSTTELVYTGPVSGFTLPARTSAELRFIASLPVGAAITDDASCTMYVTFDAWGASLGETPSGFTDSDTTEITFRVVPGSCTECASCGGGCGDTTVVVENTSSATVTNEVVVASGTGGNSARGSAGGSGGTIETGDASSSASVVTTVNTSVTNVTTDCTCSGTSCGCGAGVAATTTLPSAVDIAAAIRARVDERTAFFAR